MKTKDLFKLEDVRQRILSDLTEQLTETDLELDTAQAESLKSLIAHVEVAGSVAAIAGRFADEWGDSAGAWEYIAGVLIEQVY